jgi:hypothetical protein
MSRKKSPNHIYFLSRECTASSFGGPVSFEAAEHGIHRPVHHMKILEMIFKLSKALLRYGNQEVYFHLCWNVESMKKGTDITGTVLWRPRILK